MQQKSRLQHYASKDRGHSDLGWLDSYHSFSFAGFYDPRREGWGPLRVFNEDRVAPLEGFPTHPHRNFEIFSYVVSGQLQHKDSLGNEEILKRGDIQFTSAGNGIMHSEFNHSPTEPIHFCQIWVKPSSNGLKPNYQTKSFTDDQKLGKLKLLISPTGEDNTIQINQDCRVFATILPKNVSTTYEFPEGHLGYVHVIQTGGSAQVVEENQPDKPVLLKPGDAVYVQAGKGKITLSGTSDTPVELVLLDVAK